MHFLISLVIGMNRLKSYFEGYAQYALVGSHWAGGNFSLSNAKVIRKVTSTTVLRTESLVWEHHGQKQTRRQQHGAG